MLMIILQPVSFLSVLIFFPPWPITYPAWEVCIKSRTSVCSSSKILPDLLSSSPISSNIDFMQFTTFLCSVDITRKVLSLVVEVGMEISQLKSILILLTVSPLFPIRAPASLVGISILQTTLSSSLGSS